MAELLFEKLTYLGLILGLLLTGAGLPPPEEVLVILAGVCSAKQGPVDLNPWLALGSCLIGGIVGDLITYCMGRHWGYGILSGHGWFSKVITPEREAAAEQLFKRHGLKVFFVVRFLPGIRGPVYMTAGILRIPLRRFMLVDGLCAVTTICGFFFLSYTFADRINVWWSNVRQAEWWVLAILAGSAVVAAAAYLIYRRRTRAAPSDAALDAEPLPNGPVAAGEKKTVA